MNAVAFEVLADTVSRGHEIGDIGLILELKQPKRLLAVD
jgi:hypothetical protein